MAVHPAMRHEQPEDLVMNRRGAVSSGWHALLVSPDPEDRAMLEPMFRGRNWRLGVVETLLAALEFLRRAAVPLVIAERDLVLGSWKELLQETQNLPRAPRLVVISRMADERLWSEVLNLGAHDVLAKPLRESEVLWVCNHVLESSTAL
jgi:DNA-binding response OmpR family regulator